MALLPLGKDRTTDHTDTQFRCAPVENSKKTQSQRPEESMFAIVILLAAAALLATLVALGWTADSRQAGRQWYPAGPDLDVSKRG
jgi:hypothetical protein